jgi:DNA-directed RNA polymerase specialized sigma24 family protein
MTAPRESFELFLHWLSPDRELALKKHNEMMGRLCKYFVRKNCLDPEELAGETRDRVVKIISAGHDYPNHDALFYSVASKVWHEWVRKPKPEPLPPDRFIPTSQPETEDKELKAYYLEKCLAQLPASDRDLITRYYQGNDTIEARKALMSEYGGENTLRVKAYRIRIKLRTCMRAYMDEPGSEPK